MANNKEYELAIKIAGEIEKSFYNSTKLTKKELASIAKEAATTSKGIGDSFRGGMDEVAPLFNGIETLGKKTFKAIATAATVAATAVTAVATASIAVGTEFESAFAGVKKTTEATDEEFEAIRQGILDMASEIPATAAEISAVAEAAGQLGIQKEDLLDFTRVMIDLGESTNMTSTDAASSLAKFANITNMAADDYDNLGSVIVALGNNFATTESDIVAMGTRLAATGELTGLSQSQIMALSTAMSSVGIEAEAGGSAMSKMLKKLQMAVETGGKPLEQYASVAGVTAEQFQNMFKEDALKGLSAFLGGLNDTERNGRSAIAILDKMGLTEVRLSNTVLSLANADGVMEQAITLANSAWEENIALTKEAAQRYDTTESKMDILKNGMSGLGIAAFDQMAEPFREGIDWVTGGIADLTGRLKESNAIGNFINGVKENLPTVIRNIKDVGSAIGTFAKPFLSVGKWLVQHPDLLVSTIVGIGAALAAYKVAKGISSLATALTSLSPAGIAVLAISGVVAVIAGIVTAVKRANAELKRQNLAEHFGDIALSLEDLHDIAGYIVQTDDLGKLREALSAMEDLSSIQSSIEGSVKALNKMNWKVSIGMELTPEEQESYKSAISQFVTDTQDYVTTQHYAVNIAVGVLTDDDADGTNIITKLDAFYAGKQAELAALGTKLNDTVTEAFTDGLLDMDEVKEITELQNQMAKIQSVLAGNRFDANLDLMEMKFSGGQLDADSFQNLQAELQKQVDAAVADYDDSYTLAVSAVKVAFNEGALDQAEYEKQLDILKKGYLEQIGEIEMKASNFQLNTIMEQYADELGPAMQGLDSMVGDAFDMLYRDGEWWGAHFETIGLADIVDNDLIDKGTRLAISELLENMEPSIEQMETLKQKYQDAGLTVPDSLTKGLNDVYALGAITRDVDSVMKYTGKAAAESPEYAKLIEDFREYGGCLDDTLLEAFEEAANKNTDTSIRAVYNKMQFGIDTIFGAGFTVPGGINYATDPRFTAPKTSTPPAESVLWSNERWQQYYATGHAAGGIFSGMHPAMICEDGPESIIPINGSQNAIDLWIETGRLLGMSADSEFGRYANEVVSGGSGGAASKTEHTFTYSPTLNFYGDKPSREDLDDALHDSQEEFDARMRQWMRDNERLDFA